MYCSPENPQRWEVAKTTKKHACFSYKICFLKSFWDAFELKFFYSVSQFIDGEIDSIAAFKRSASVEII